MQGESPKLASTPTAAVFVSYASQDAEAASRICSALRAGGIEVWLDQSELRGGDAWDRQIRERIHDCRLFIALISVHTEARDEGYFRREWKLAVDRTHDMLEKKAFLLPVAIDATPERGAAVPDKFHEVQWTRLPGGEAPPEFVARVRRLLSPDPPATARLSADAPAGSSALSRTTARRILLRHAFALAGALLVLTALAYLLINKPWISKPAAPPAASKATPAAQSAGFNPPPHSVAVLAFVNMSGDKEQEYFSDGLTEEILNSLARVNELQVAARTSSFSFKGEKVDLGTIARKLNVAAILEGSVRRSARRVRVTAQLDNAVTGFRLWSQTYDRDLGDVLDLQTELATAVASALKVSLLGDSAFKFELGGTRNPAAFDAYLRGLKTERTDPDDTQAVIAAQTEAVGLDSGYALAFASRSLALTRYADYFSSTRASTRDAFDKALKDARTAIAAAPELSEGHAALAEVLQKGFLEFARAKEEYERAVTLAPSNATALTRYGYFVAAMGDASTGIAAAQRAVALDRLNPASYEKLGATLMRARRFQESLTAYRQALTLDPHLALAIGGSGLVYYALGDLQSARSTCVIGPDLWISQLCLAVTYNKLGQRAEAEAMLAKLRASGGDTVAYQLAQIYAQWGNRSKALAELGRALRLRDPGMHLVKTDFLLDPIRGEPRFRAIEKELKFPG